MSDLGALALIVGGVMVMLSLPMFVYPEAALKALQHFPRSRRPAWLLTAVTLVWAAMLLYHTPLGRFDSLKPLIFVLAPVTFGLVVVFMDELLAPRALGGLLVLVPAPMLTIARWHASPFRLVMVVIAYAMVIRGIVLLLSPYRFRLWVRFFVPDAVRCRRWGMVGSLAGASVILLGLLVY